MSIDHNSSAATAKPTVTIPMTVLLPLHLQKKNDYKNEIYFQERQRMIQQIVTYLQQQNDHPFHQYFTVHLHAMDIRKSCIVLQLVHNSHNNNNNNNQHQNDQKTTWIRKMQKYCTLQIVLQFQLSNIDWIQSNLIVRLLPNRNNNNTTNNTNKTHPPKNSATVSNSTTIRSSDDVDDKDHLHSHLTTTSCSVQYNYAITEDMIHQLNHNNSNDTMLFSNMTLRHGISLIVLWCTQRGLYQSMSVDTKSGSATVAQQSYFNDTIILQLVQYLIYTKRIIISSSNKDPMTVLLSFLTLLSETQWDNFNTNYQRNEDDTHHPSDIGTTSRNHSQKQLPLKRRPHSQRAILIQPQYIGQPMTEIVQSSMLAQRYKSMVDEEVKHQHKTQMKPQHTNVNTHGTNGANSLNTSPTMTLVEFLATTPYVQTPALYHASLQHNYLFRLSIHFMHSAQLYATKSLACIYPTSGNVTVSHTDPYHHLFQRSTTLLSLTQHPQRDDLPLNQVPNVHHKSIVDTIFYSLHDAYIRLPLIDVIDLIHLSATTTTTPPSIYGHDWKDDILDIGFDEALLRGIIRTLRYALNDRIVNIQAIIVETTKDRGHATIHSMNTNRKGKDEQKKVGSHVVRTKFIVIGVTINPDTCYRVVDRCITGNVGNGNHNSPEQSQQQQNDQHHSLAVRDFLALWGNKAGLRRFKDGAIVYAVTWDDKSIITDGSDSLSSACLQYHNDDTWQGGIVECIIRHILKIHFLKPGTMTVPKFLIRDIISMIDGIIPTNTTNVTTPPFLTNPMFAHRSAMKAFDTLSEWLLTNSKPTIPILGSATAMKSVLGTPLSIDRVEPLSPVLRYVALYPPIPHPLLITGGKGTSSALIVGQKNCSGAVQSDPIHIQICFSRSSKWPNDVKAIGAAKTAMLIELVNGIAKVKESGVGDTVCQFFNEKSMFVTPSYADIPFMGYVFRVSIKADHEVRILQNLQNPSKDAERMLQKYRKHCIVAAKHHALIHGVYTNHPSSSATVRLVKRWLSSHLLPSNIDDGYCIPFEVIELTVAYIYSNPSHLIGPPTTVTSGFMRWLYFVIDFKWQERPLVVDPQNHLNDADHGTILDQFERDRGGNFEQGPSWYIVAPYDDAGRTKSEFDDNNTIRKQWSPSFSETYPEQIVATRIIALAQRTYSFLQSIFTRYNDGCNNVSDSMWPSIFQESRDSFLSYSALLRIDPTFLVNVHASSSVNARNLFPQRVMTKVKGGNDIEIYESTYTRSMHSLVLGPKDLQKKMYRNLIIEGESNDNNLIVLTEWQPVCSMLQVLRSRLGKLLLFFYNDQYPDVIGIVWRQPNMFQSRAFSALTSEHAGPSSTDPWSQDTMITNNVFDVLRSIALYSDSFVTDVKVFDHGELG